MTNSWAEVADCLRLLAPKGKKRILCTFPDSCDFIGGNYITDEKWSS